MEIVYAKFGRKVLRTPYVRGQTEVKLHQISGPALGLPNSDPRRVSPFLKNNYRGYSLCLYPIIFLLVCYVLDKKTKATGYPHCVQFTTLTENWCID